MNEFTDELEDSSETITTPYWRCEECGHENHKKALPANRKAFYANGRQPSLCRKCGSRGMMPVGW